MINHFGYFFHTEIVIKIYLIYPFNRNDFFFFKRNSSTFYFETRYNFIVVMDRTPQC